MSTIDGVTLDREAIARVDASDQATDILAIPEHLRDALWKVESAASTPWDSPGGLVVAGHGRLGHRRRAGARDPGRPRLAAALSAREYGLPPWTTPDTTVLCASYSGDTEETLACFEAAGVIGRAARRGHLRRPAGRAGPRRGACPSSRSPAASSRARRWPT